MKLYNKLFKFLLPFICFLSSNNLFAHGISDDAKAAMINGGYFRYILLGAEHMVTGYDHLLFLFGVVFFLTSFKDILKFISVFTLGHSITLIGASFMGITANYWAVDAIIALSVIYKGFDNNQGFQNYLGFKKAPNLLYMVFGFGLIHGFGLATRLQQLPLGEQDTSMFMRIVSFNIGVEFGQIFALTIVLIFLKKLRNTNGFNRFAKIANDALMVAGALLFLMQMHGYQHSINPDEFGFAKDNHAHAHEDDENRNNDNGKKHENL
jgi:hypothetical protein